MSWVRLAQKTASKDESKIKHLHALLGTFSTPGTHASPRSCFCCSVVVLVSSSKAGGWCPTKTQMFQLIDQGQCAKAWGILQPVDVNQAYSVGWDTSWAVVTWALDFPALGNRVSVKVSCSAVFITRLFRKTNFPKAEKVNHKGKMASGWLGSPFWVLDSIQKSPMWDEDAK